MEAGGWHLSSSNADLLNYRSLFMEVGVWGLGTGLAPALALAGP